MYMGFCAAYGALGAETLAVAPPDLAALVVGSLGSAIGLSVIVVAQQQMGESWRVGIDTEKTDLVTTGLYAHIRAPIYAGVLVVVASVVVLAPHVALVVGFPILLATLMWQARREERHMRSLHPEAFDAWAAKTGRFLPGLGRL